MTEMFDDSLDMTITSIEAVYDFNKTANGHFLVCFNHDNESPFKLSFVPFLDYLIRKDEKLFVYLKEHVIHEDDSITVSHAISDLYEIGFPVEDLVREYIDVAKKSVNPSLFNALVQFYLHLKDFGDTSGSLEK